MAARWGKGALCSETIASQAWWSCWWGLALLREPGRERRWLSRSRFPGSRPLERGGSEPTVPRMPQPFGPPHPALRRPPEDSGSSAGGLERPVGT